MTTYMEEKWDRIFMGNKVWREQKAKIDAMGEIGRRLYRQRIVALEIGDIEEAKSLRRRMQGYILAIERAEAKLETIEAAIVDTYELRNNSWDYSRDLDDEYFIERIDLDGYLRGTIL